ncbi:MAG: hypothetical protein ACLFQW_05055 [Spirochaetaceae bacterium]
MSTHKFLQTTTFTTKSPVSGAREKISDLRGKITVLLTGAMLLLAAAPLAAQESFFDKGEEEGSDSGKGGSLRWSGEIDYTSRMYMDWDWSNLDGDEIARSPKIAWPELLLEAEYEGEYSKAVGSLEYSAARPLESGEDLINEAYFTLYYDTFDLSAGYMKQVWGTTDGVHVVDRLNPMDYTDFVLPDYRDRNIAEKMVKLDFYVGDQGKVELAYVPLFTPHRFSTDPEGRWTPGQLKEMYEILGIKTADDESYGVFLNTLEEELSDASLGDGQYALRYSDSAGGFDFGATYYFGFMREPTAEWVFSEGEPVIDSIHFDRMHLFGAEAATVVKGFNMRAEGGYLMTHDFSGDDNERRNHRIEWVAGFDRNIPLSNLNFQVQTVGSYIMYNDKIEDPDPATTPQIDPDYDADGDYSSNTVTARLSDSYAHDTIKPEIRGSYNLEKRDFMIVPELELVLRDDATLNVSTAFLGSLDNNDTAGEFEQYEDNDFFEMEFGYSF